MSDTVEISRTLYYVLLFGPPAAILVGVTLGLFGPSVRRKSSRRT